ncbi:hypothetical protein CsSME_00036082 [Camellia sinensis var. sinensis]
MQSTILAISGAPVSQIIESSSTNLQIDSQNPLQMCRHCEGLNRNFKKIMDKGKKVSEELDQLRDEEKQLRATIRTLTNQLKKLTPEKAPTSFLDLETRQLTSEEFEQLSDRMYFFRYSIIRSFCEKNQEIKDLKPYIYTLAENSRNSELVTIQ